MRRVHVIVRGRVQGVGYRYTAQLKADEIGVSGWVRNRDDGTVEAEVEGTPEQVDEMVSWLGKGPPSARVAGVKVTEVAPRGGRGFKERY